jgi:hypothetical protein
MVVTMPVNHLWAPLQTLRGAAAVRFIRTRTTRAALGVRETLTV